MRRGRSPTITLGPYAGDQLSVDHACPQGFAPAMQAGHPVGRGSKLGQPSGGGSRESDHALHDPQGDTSVRREGINIIANLELMPLRINQGKRDRMGERQMDLLNRLRRAGLLRKGCVRGVKPEPDFSVPGFRFAPIRLHSGFHSR